MKRANLKTIFMQRVGETATSCARTAMVYVHLRQLRESWHRRPPGKTGVRKRAADVEQKLIAWRRDIHQHPELGDQEKRTAKLVAEHLRGLGLDVRTGVARTGVVGVLKGAKPGRTVALRADMDALPVKETTGLPFASTATAQYKGAEVPVMHACGHDTHTAMLMATAEVLTGMKSQIPGTVVFIFQPAEEGSSMVEPGDGELGSQTHAGRRIV